MVNQRPFLLEALALINNNTFPFQQHFKASCDLLIPLACACLFSFEQLIGQQMVRFQIPFRSIYTIIPFPACFPIGYLKPIVLEFYHVLAQGQVLGLQFDQAS